MFCQNQHTPPSDFVLSNNEDFIGMPVVGVQSRSCDLRGVPLENLDDGLVVVCGWFMGFVENIGSLLSVRFVRG